MKSEVDITIKGLKCLRCGHTWVPRDRNKVKICPKCKSPYWDRERKNVRTHKK